MGRSRSRSHSRDRRRSYSYSRSPSPDDGHRVHVADLGIEPSKRDIVQVFEKFGPIIDIWLARNPPCFAFIVYKYRDEAERAIREMDGKALCGGRVRVSFARPRTKGRRRRGFDPNLRCYQCGEKGHFSRDCADVWRNRKRDRSRTRSRSRSRSRGRQSGRRRSRRSESRSRSRSNSRTRSSRRKSPDDKRDSGKRSKKHSRSSHSRSSRSESPKELKKEKQKLVEDEKQEEDPEKDSEKMNEEEAEADISSKSPDIDDSGSQNEANGRTGSPDPEDYTTEQSVARSEGEESPVTKNVESEPEGEGDD